jgi:hypothetical protein
MGIPLYAFAKMLSKNNTEIKKLKCVDVFLKKEKLGVRNQIASKNCIIILVHTHTHTHITWIVVTAMYVDKSKE